MIKVIGLFMMLVCLACASEPNVCSDTRLYTVVDLTGLSGCGLVLQDETGAFYEALNLFEVFESVNAGDTFNGQLQIENDFSSICQSGQIVTLVCVE